MKTITSAIFAIAFSSFATVSIADTPASTGFTTVDQANAVCTYGKRADRKRDLNCVH
ncbi:hypothetical protein [Litoribacillus peritrichatus]|uniref:Uncharacterized protein n=1 Tax=Litoribacillus peritrichatus TaxID=718191 RepID=A0ABP7MAP9_9GAMM